MSELKRYRLEAASGSGGSTWLTDEENIQGDWCKYEDIASLQEKVAKLGAELVEAAERFETRTIDFNNAYNATTAYAQQVRELKAECERLRADAARLDFVDSMWMDDEVLEGIDPNNFKVGYQIREALDEAMRAHLNRAHLNQSK